MIRWLAASGPGVRDDRARPILTRGDDGLGWRAAGVHSVAFDQEVLEREIAALPRCAYSKGCNRPVTQEGGACKKHVLAVSIEGKPRDRDVVEKVARSLRTYQDGDYFCEERLENGELCGRKLREWRGWRIAKRKASAEDGVLRCASCAAKRSNREHPRSKGRWRLCPTCGEGPDWVMPHQEHIQHCRRCFRSAPDVRALKREARSRYLATPEGSAAHDVALQHAHTVTRAATAALLDEGLVGTRLSAQLLYRSPTSLRSVVGLERREFGSVVRLGTNARDVLRAAPDKDARRKLAKPLAVLNGARHGRPPALSDPELRLVAELRAADPDRWSWRVLAAKVNESRPADDRQVSHMAVKRAFESLCAASRV
jgi:hypothetical protein